MRYLLEQGFQLAAGCSSETKKFVIVVLDALLGQLLEFGVYALKVLFHTGNYSRL